MTFDEVVSYLRKHGYTVEVQHPYNHKPDYALAGIKGHGIRGYFSNDSSEMYIGCRIVADHLLCFDKYSKCPVNVPFPISIAQGQELLDILNYWGSEEGYEKSDSYQFDSWVTGYIND